MVGHYGRSYSEFWTGSTGRAMAALPSIVRELAHFLYSGPNTVKYGLYNKPVEIMAIEFGRPAAKIRQVLSVLTSLEYAYFDEGTAFVWVPKMAFYQYRPLPLKTTDHNIKAARKWYRDVPRNPFLGEFFDRYNVDFHLSDRELWPGTEVERREWVGTSAVVVAAPAEPGVALVKRERRAALDVRQLEADFEAWWTFYPKKTGKLAARGEWLKAQPTRDTPIAEMIAKLQEQVASHDWTKEDRKWIPDPERYIKKGRWLDEVRRQRAPLAKQNEGTLGALMELADEEWDLGTDRPAQISERARAGGGRYEDPT